MATARAPRAHDLEVALSALISWATRNDVHQETMRRARCDLPKGHAWLLTRLDTCGPLRLGELATVLGVDASTLSPQVQRLERDGLVAREADPDDRRAVLVRVTPAGRRLLTRMHVGRRTVLTERLRDWTQTEREQAAAVLARLAQALQ